MSNINNGGPALPVPHNYIDKFGVGLSMRDYFAAKALSTVIADWMNTGDIFHDSEIPEVIARDCYLIADAMLRAREAA